MIDSSNPEPNLESAGTLGSWRGVPCLGVALNEFREDSGKLAPEWPSTLPSFFGFIASPHAHCASIKRSLPIALRGLVHYRTGA